MSIITVRLEALSFPFALSTNDKKFLTEFVKLNSALTVPLDGKPPVVQYDVIRHNKYFCIKENGKFRQRYAHRWPLYLFVMMCIRENLYAFHKDYLFLHSGAVVKNNKAVILVGPSGRGKSTLTLSLLNYGYKYLTDEVVAIKLSSLEVVPFQRPIYIYGWQSILSDTGGENYKFYRFKEMYNSTMQFWQYTVPQKDAILPKESGFKIAWIVFPRYNENQKKSFLKRISKAEAAFHLMCNGWNNLRFDDRGLKVCAELVTGADCYQLEMGDLKEACELIERLTGNSKFDNVASEIFDNIWEKRGFF